MDTAIDTIIAGCRKNDLQSQQKLYKLFYPDMIKICCRYAGDMDGAGIIYNNAMLKVFKNINRYAEEGKFAGWVKTIVINSSIDFCKQKNLFKRSVEYKEIDEVSLLPEVFNHVSGKEIQQVIAKLPAATATVFNMFIYEGYTHRQIAEILGIGDGTSKWHVSEAKRLLKTTFEKFLQKETRANAAG
ncbi:MAG: sigma-70 family RNA polymerase sigma factor [Rhizobacter sp.]|nr:sigma-70 family RNA polymerase sigma factor [Ferruginibacter sp.]